MFLNDGGPSAFDENTTRLFEMVSDWYRLHFEMMLAKDREEFKALSTKAVAVYDELHEAGVPGFAWQVEESS